MVQRVQKCPRLVGIELMGFELFLGLLHETEILSSTVTAAVNCNEVRIVAITSLSSLEI
jgi:hypothetical protein